MKHFLITIIIMSALLAGCSRAPIRPDVEGFWKLRQFTLVSTGETVECSNLYYSITNVVTQVSEREGSNGYGAYVSRTEYRDNETKLVLKDFKVSGSRYRRRCSCRRSSSLRNKLPGRDSVRNSGMQRRQDDTPFGLCRNQT